MSQTASKARSLADEWRELAARHARVTETLERELQRRHGLSITEFEALRRLSCADTGSCRLQELEDTVHMSQSALSRLVGRLELDGLVERRLCTQDRRGIDAVLTEAGRERLAQAEPTQLSVLEQTLRS